MMRSKTMKSFIITVGLFVLSASPTFAGTTLSILGLGDYSYMKVAPSTAVRSSLAGGGGLDLGVGNKSVSVHLGAFYDPKSYSYDASGFSFTLKENRVLVPLTLWVTP